MTSSLSLRARIEDEMESYRDGIYNELKMLLQTPKKYLSLDIKKAIHTHLTHFNWGETWMEEGEYLIGRAHADIAQRKSEEDNDDFWDVDYDHEVEARKAEERFDEQVEFWEGRLDNQKTKNDGYDNKGHSNTHHRTGIKRNKQKEFWSRSNPTKRRQIKQLSKLGQLQHQQRNDY